MNRDPKLAQGRLDKVGEEGFAYIGYALGVNAPRAGNCLTRIWTFKETSGAEVQCQDCTSPLVRADLPDLP